MSSFAYNYAAKLDFANSYLIFHHEMNIKSIKDVLKFQNISLFTPDLLSV